MADGTSKPIEDIEVGDKVLATDPETGEQVARKVTRVWSHDDTVVDLEVDGEVITTTEDHLFWSVTDGRFERADQLAPGELVLGADGRLLTVSGLKLGTEREALAYNLSIDGVHTYHVGDEEVLVHNDCASLKLLHSESSLSKSSLDHFNSMSTDDIIASLRPGSRSPLLVKSDGTIMDGNTRIYVLQSRGVDVDTLPRTPYEPQSPPEWFD